MRCEVPARCGWDASGVSADGSLRTSRTCGGGSIRYRARMACASPWVLASPNVGPDPTTEGSSPGTSEISNVATAAPGAAWSASRPPFTAERCLRTQFISWMVAPERSSAAVTCCLWVSVMPGTGAASSALAPPEIRHSRRSSGPQCLRLIQEPGGGRLSRLVGYGVGRLDDFDPRARHAVAIRRDREPAERRVPGLVGSLGHNRRRLAGTQDQGPARAVGGGDAG